VTIRGQKGRRDEGREREEARIGLLSCHMHAEQSDGQNATSPISLTTHNHTPQTHIEAPQTGQWAWNSLFGLQDLPAVTLRPPSPVMQCLLSVAHLHSRRHHHTTTTVVPSPHTLFSQHRSIRPDPVNATRERRQACRRQARLAMATDIHRAPAQVAFLFSPPGTPTPPHPPNRETHAAPSPTPTMGDQRGRGKAYMEEADKVSKTSKHKAPPSLPSLPDPTHTHPPTRPNHNLTNRPLSASPSSTPTKSSRTRRKPTPRRGTASRWPRHGRREGRPLPRRVSCMSSWAARTTRRTRRRKRVSETEN